MLAQLCGQRSHGGSSVGPAGQRAPTLRSQLHQRGGGGPAERPGLTVDEPRQQLEQLRQVGRRRPRPAAALVVGLLPHRGQLPRRPAGLIGLRLPPWLVPAHVGEREPVSLQPSHGVRRAATQLAHQRGEHQPLALLVGRHRASRVPVRKRLEHVAERLGLGEPGELGGGGRVRPARCHRSLVGDGACQHGQCATGMRRHGHRVRLRQLHHRVSRTGARREAGAPGEGVCERRQHGGHMLIRHNPQALLQRGGGGRATVGRHARVLECAGRHAEPGHVVLHVQQRRVLQAGERLDQERDEARRVRGQVGSGALHQLEKLPGAGSSHLRRCVEHATVEQRRQNNRQHGPRLGLRRLGAVGQPDAGGAERAPRRLGRGPHRLLDVVQRAEQLGVQLGQHWRQLGMSASGQQLGQRQARPLPRPPETVAERVAQVAEHGLQVGGERLLRVGHQRRPQLPHRPGHPGVRVVRVSVQGREERWQVLVQSLPRVLSQREGDALARVPDGRRGGALHQLVHQLRLPHVCRNLGQLSVGGHFSAGGRRVCAAGGVQPRHELAEDGLAGGLVAAVEEGRQALGRQLLRRLVRIGQQTHKHALNGSGRRTHIGLAAGGGGGAQDGEEPGGGGLTLERSPGDGVLQ
mmetsp:Transcript_1565/g.5046  ORF Transcript_1565/g.5046 Transcript_1565/m.5046 type:complete len:635 (+) Transcript_1565:615-2519(+)